MRYDGGKGAMGVAQWIINQIPPHRVYIEPFLGGGAVLRMKAPARSSIGIERDARALTLWRGHNLPELRVIRGDAISWLAKFRPRGDEFIYCDPPYLFSTRTSQVPIYRCELTDADPSSKIAGSAESRARRRRSPVRTCTHPPAESLETAMHPEAAAIAENAEKRRRISSAEARVRWGCH